MLIKIIQPCGLCVGAKLALEKAKKIISSNKSRNIYFIGNIIHNKKICQSLLKNKNVKFLENSASKTINFLMKIKTKKIIIVFSAHGKNFEINNLAIKNKWTIYDLTCKHVLCIQNKILKAISEGYYVCYYGNKNHVESMNAKNLGKNKLEIYDENNMHKLLNQKKQELYLIPQSSANNYLFEKTIDFFKKNKQKIIIDNQICSFIKKRQQMAIEAKKYDLVFVLSDKQSNNGINLFKEIKKNNKKSFFVDTNNMKIVPKINSKSKCAIYSSCSTSIQQVNEFIDMLNKKVI